jgi:hypothetical protein
VASVAFRPDDNARRADRVLRYFLAWHRLIDACQSPPARSQSAWLVIVDSDEPVDEPDGLADGDVEEPEPDGGADIEPLLEPEPVAPVLPLLPVLPLAPVLPVPPAPLLEPAAPEPLPAPLPV